MGMSEKRDALKMINENMRFMNPDWSIQVVDQNVVNTLDLDPKSVETAKRMDSIISDTGSKME
jgi:hypothetical protein